MPGLTGIVVAVGEDFGGDEVTGEIEATLPSLESAFVNCWSKVVGREGVN